MLAATKVKMSGSKKSEQDVRHFPIKRVLGRFWKFHVVVEQNSGKEMYKKVCCTCKVAFLQIRHIVVF